MLQKIKKFFVQTKYVQNSDFHLRGKELNSGKANGPCTPTEGTHGRYTIAVLQDVLLYIMYEQNNNTDLFLDALNLFPRPPGGETRKGDAKF